MLLGSALDTGGAERVIANLARRLDPDRFRVTACHLVKPRGAIGDELVRDGHDVADAERSERGVQRYLSFRALARVVRDRRIDVIHSHTHYALTDASLCSLSMLRRVKVVHTFHFGNYPHVPGRYRALELFGSRVADRLVAVGHEHAAQIRRTYRLAERRLAVVTNGVDRLPGEVDAGWQARLRATGAVVIGTICTFIEQKGLPDLLRVAGRLRDAGVNARFVVVGDGALRPAIEAECRTAGLTDYVHFAGWKQGASATMLPLFDVFFQPSLWEAMSMVILEAMAAGVPVVATDVGDNRHVIVDGESGRIVPRGDVGAMAAALTELAASPDARRRMAAAGRLRHARQYTVDHMAASYAAIYDDVLGAGRQRRAVAAM